MRFKITKFCEGNFPMTTRLPNLYFKHKSHWRNLMATSARKHAVSNSSELQYLCQVHYCPCVHQNLNYHRFYRLPLLKELIQSTGVSVVHFKMSCHMQCKQISPFVDSLCDRHPSVNFLNVNDPPFIYFSDTRLENNRNVFFRIGGRRGESWSCKCRKHKDLTNIQDIQKRLLPQGNGVSESRNAWTLSDTL